MAIPSSAAEPPGLPEIWQELRALRLELAELRRSLSDRPDVAPAASASTPALLVSTPSEPPLRSVSAATLLARCNGERLQQEVRRRLATAAPQPDDGSEPDVDTEVDLLIDRLHDLADVSSSQP